MNIHEHQAKEILKKFGIPILDGVVIYDVKEVTKKIKKLNSSDFVIKAQIHAGGRGKAGGIKIIKNFNKLNEEVKNMFEKTLITHQTGPSGKKVNRIYIEETCEIKKEFYLSCLVDRSSSKIAFISSTAGGVDIEKVAKENPNKIITTRIDLKDSIDEVSVNKILSTGWFFKKFKNLIT